MRHAVAILLVYMHIHTLLSVYIPSCVLLYSSWQEFLKAGYVVQVISKVCGKSLRVLENGALDCAGDTGTACESHISCVDPRVAVLKPWVVANTCYSHVLTD